MWSRYLEKIATHTILYGFSNVLLSLAGVLLIPILVRSLTVEDFGRVSVVNAYGSVLLYVLDMGLIRAFARLYFDNEEENHRRALTSTLLWFYLGISILLVISVLYLAPFVSTWVTGRSEYYVIISMMTLTVGLNIIAGVPLTLLNLKEKPWLYLLASFYKSLAIVGFTYLLVSMMGKGLDGAFVAVLLVASTLALFLLLVTFREYAFHFSILALRNLLRLGLPFWPAACFIWIVDYSDLYFIQHFAPLSEVGVYALGYKVGQIVFYIILAFSLSWNPIMFSIAKEREARAGLAEAIKWFVILLAFVALVVASSREWMVMILGSATTLQAKDVVPFVAFAYFFYGLYLCFLSGLILAKEIRLIPVILGSGAVANLVFNFVLIKSFGMRGAAISTLISYLLIFLAAFYASQRIYPVPLRVRFVAMIVAIGIVSYGGGELLHTMSESRWLGTVSSMLLFVAMLYGFRIITQDSIGTIAKLFTAKWMGMVKYRENVGGDI